MNFNFKTNFFEHFSTFLMYFEEFFAQNVKLLSKEYIVVM